MGQHSISSVSHRGCPFLNDGPEIFVLDVEGVNPRRRDSSRIRQASQQPSAFRPQQLNLILKPVDSILKLAHLGVNLSESLSPLLIGQPPQDNAPLKIDNPRVSALPVLYPLGYIIRV